MSDEPTERDVEALALSLCPVGHLYVSPASPCKEHRAQARAVLTSDWYTGRIAQARREGAAEALAQAASELDDLPSYRFEGGEDHYGDDRIHAYGRDEEAERIAQWLRSRAALRGAA